jgi:hypothetical protein
LPSEPEPLVRLDQYLGVSRLAHEAIWDLHRRLAARDRATDRTRELLAEAAEIAGTEMPRLAAGAGRLASRWVDEQVLDPAAACERLRALESEFSRVEPEIARLRKRQNEIAAELRRLLEESGGV